MTGCLPPTLAIGAFIGIVFGAIAWPTPRVEKISWSAASGKPVPDNFQFLMAPAALPCPLYDAAGVEQALTLDRALGNTEGELRGGGPIPVQIAEGNLFVNRVDLRFIDDPVADQPLIAAWVTATRDRLSKDRITVDFKTETVNGQTRYVVWTGDPSKYLKWVYSLSSAGPIAIEERFWSRMTGVARDVVIFQYAAVAGVATAVIVGFGSSWLLRRRMRRATNVAPRA